MAASRPKLLITGAAGGMGRACARLMGGTHDLVLTDVAQAPLDSFAAELERDGYSMSAARAGDLGGQGLLDALADDLVGDLPWRLIHTAGLSPSLADWKAIMTVNLIATDKLLNAIEPMLRPGSAGVVIASTAAHLRSPPPEAEALLEAPQVPDFLDRIGPIIETAGAAREGVSYSFSKAAVIRQCERRAVEWGQRGARLSTISPGLILTPMGRSEVENTEGAAAMRDAAPLGRAGTPMDIALAAQFLLSDAANFITGCDLRVDGGSIPFIREMMAAQKP